MTHLIDSFGRKLDYLRVSLTDRCNFRCTYCMPPEGISLLPREDILRLSEIEHLVRLFVELGIKKVRLTGGEPLLRSKTVSFVSNLAHLERLQEICLTTNGSYLKDLAQPFYEAGLTGINISLDSLIPERFKQITRRNDFDSVWQGIQSALKTPLKIKINVVALQDLSREEVFQFCDLALAHPIEIRFIEFMPLCGTGYLAGGGLSMLVLEGWIREYLSLKPITHKGQVANTYSIAGSSGKIGFISSLSQPFCDTCSRLRLTSSGALRLCLFSPVEIDLKTYLRTGTSDEEIKNIIVRSAFCKPKGHQEIRTTLKNEELPKIRSIGG